MDSVRPEELRTPTPNAALLDDKDVIFRTTPPWYKSSRILEAMKANIAIFRASLGNNLCIFKIGISSCIIWRWEKYKSERFERMMILLVSNSVMQVECFEAFLIDYYRDQKECRNLQGGGESLRSWDGFPRNPAPYYVYCVGARADSPYGIGG